MSVVLKGRKEHGKLSWGKRKRKVKVLVTVAARQKSIIDKLRLPAKVAIGNNYVRTVSIGEGSGEVGRQSNKKQWNV